MRVSRLTKVFSLVHFRTQRNRQASAPILLLAAASLLAPALSAQSSEYTINTIAGDNSLGAGYTGDGAAALAAQFNNPYALALDKAGNIFISDQLNNVVRVVNSSGTVTTFAGDATVAYAGDGALAINASLDRPCGLWVDGSGNLFIADNENDRVREVTAADLNINTLAGSSNTGYAGDGSAANIAGLYHPSAVTLDPSGNLVFSDTGTNRIRRVLPNGIIWTIVGDGTANYKGDGGLAIEAEIDAPLGLRYDSAGNLYFADSMNNVIRKVDTNGVITTVVGNNTAGYSGDRGPATQASLFRPFDVTVDKAGNLYIADTINSRIRKVATDGVITTIAGNGKNAYAGDGGPGSQASLNYPTGLALDSKGNIYFADAQNNVVRELTPPANPGTAPSINTNGVITLSDFGARQAVAPGSWVEIYGTNLASTTRSWTTADFTYYLGPTTLDNTSVAVGGLAAYVGYVSPTQVNVQLPSNLSTGTQYLSVTTPTGTTGSVALTVSASQADLWAPKSLTSGGKQYVGAILSDGNFAMPAGAVKGISSRPAKPGETITLFGIGFGSVTPAIAAGRIAMDTNTLTGQVQASIGGATASVTSASLALGSVGLYQFSVVVPQTAVNSAAPFIFTLNGAAGPQTLYIAVGN